MELRLAFTEFLLAFCAVVLADRVYGFSARIAAAFGLSPKTSQTIEPALRAGMAHDWYVHFHRSTITGELNPTPRPVASAPRTSQAPTRRPRPDSRPRLRA